MTKCICFCSFKLKMRLFDDSKKIANTIPHGWYTGKFVKKTNIHYLFLIKTLSAFRYVFSYIVSFIYSEKESVYVPWSSEDNHFTE